jgi:Protein of unknown function (DUF998)
MMDFTSTSTRVRTLAFVTLGGVICFISTIGSLHLLQPEFNPLNEAISYYVHGVNGWLLTFGLFGLGLGSLALTMALGCEVGGKVSRGSRWGLGIWSVGVLLGAIFAADPPGQWDKPPSTSGSIHGLAAMIALVVFPVSAVLASLSFRANARWDGFSGGLLGLAKASAVMLVVFMSSLVPVFLRPGPPILLGLTERALFLVYVVWLAAAAVGLLRISVLRTAEPD